jgi:hypothetical protein
MDIKRKTSDIRIWGGGIRLDMFSTKIYTRVPWRRNPQHRSLLTAVSATSAPPLQPLRHQRNIWHVSQTSCESLYAKNTTHRKQERFIYEYPLY